MLVNFLSADQAARYGQYSQAPSPAQLARYFYLDSADLHWIRRRSEPSLQLGLAIQLGTVRFLGTFLEVPLAFPETVIAFNAEQLGFTVLTDLPRYAKTEARFDHKRHIREGYGYRDFSDVLSSSPWRVGSTHVGSVRPSERL